MGIKGNEREIYLQIDKSGIDKSYNIELNIDELDIDKPDNKESVIDEPDMNESGLVKEKRKKG